MIREAPEPALGRWLPQVAAWVVAALVGLGVYQARIAVLERADVEHDRRIDHLEGEERETRKLLARLEALLEELADRDRDRRRSGDGR